MKKYLLLSAIFLSTVALFSFPKTCAATGYQQNVYIYNSTSTVLTDYQVKLDFNSQIFDFANASSTGADIYFTDASDTVLNHWIKSFSSTGTSTIWVKVPSVAASATTTLRMHYGDPSVTTTYSNASTTFLFYDGFDSGSFADWTGSETNVVASSESTTQSTTTDKYTSPSYSAKLYMQANCMTPPWNGAGTTISRTINVGAGAYALDYSIWRQITDFPFSTTAVISNSVAINSVNMGGASSTCSGNGCTFDGSWSDGSANLTTSTAITSLSLSGYADDCTTGNTFYDDVRIRKYTATEPVVSLEVATINYVAGTGGSILGSATQSGYIGFNGSAVTSTPNTGYSFVSWSDSLLTASRTDSNITTNTTYTASFLINTYTVSYTANTNGTISGSSTQYINHGSDGSTVTGTPNTGYYFVDWSDGLLTSSRTETSVTGTISVAANFAVTTRTLEYLADSNGSLSGSSTQIVDYGSSGTAVTAVADSGYRFLRWGDASTANPRTDSSISDNLSVTASFERIPSGGALTIPSGIGDGATDKIMPMNMSGYIGTITSTGINYLTYINSNADFDISVSGSGALQNHHIIITNLDLSKKVIQFTLESSPQSSVLKIGETVEIDLNNDKQNDIEITFTNIWINRAELTMKSLLSVEKQKTISKLEVVQQSAKYVFKRNLELGMKGADVKELQKYLNNNGFVVDKTGTGSPGKESTTFGTLTEQAVIKFQKANKIVPALGYFGPITRKTVNTK